jgi:hypothetical protein
MANDVYYPGGIDTQSPVIKAYESNKYNQPGENYGAPVGAQIPGKGTFAGYDGPNSYVTSGQYDRDVKAGAAAMQARDDARFASSGVGGVGGGGGGGSVSYSMGYQGPKMDMPKFNAPKAYKSPAYNAPEYDEGLERKMRQQYMAPGMSQVRRSMQQATISSKSIDNPNARALFINQAFEGAGSAISQVAGTATRSAQAGAQARYSDELSKYDKEWNIQNNDAKLAWDTEWMQAMKEYEVGLGLFSQMPLTDQVSAYNSDTGTGGGKSTSGLKFSMGRWW